MTAAENIASLLFLLGYLVLAGCVVALVGSGIRAELRRGRERRHLKRARDSVSLMRAAQAMQQMQDAKKEAGRG